MRHAFTLLALLTLPALVASPCMAGPKAFKETSDYRKDSEVKGYLNLKYDTYAQMFEEPKGTNCDWVFRSSDFNLADLRKSGVTYYAGGLSTGTAGNPYLDFALMGAYYGNGLASSFENQVMGIGIQVSRPNAPKAGDDPSKADQVKLASLKAKLDADLTGMDLEIEKAQFEDDKKLGIPVAVKNAQARKDERHAKAQALINELEAKLAATKPASTNPEDQKGYVLVLYLMESGMNTASMILSPVSTNSTTAEFIVLKDGKPVLAARHTAVSAAWGSSSNKCGQKLASAFSIK